MMGQLSGTLIFSLVGRQGAGKTSIGCKWAYDWGVPHIEASAVVRQVCGPIARGNMPDTSARTAREPDWLGNAISDRIDNFSASVVLTGVREVEVHQALMKRGAELCIIHIDASQVVRWLRHKGVKSDTFGEFLEHEQNEWRIGLGCVIDSAGLTIDTSESPSVQQSVDLIYDSL